MIRKKRAFTLAEVLVTLGIIGIIAALTIPTLMQKTNKRETISAVKKSYNTLSNTIDLMVLHEGNPRKWDLNFDKSSDDAIKVAEKLKPYLKITKDCGISEPGCVYNDYYRNLNGERRAKYNYEGNNFYKMSLADGSAVMVRSAETSKLNKYSLFFLVDINGTKGPNQIGYDLFCFYVSPNGKFSPIWTEDFPDSEDPKGECKLSDSGDRCSGFILENDNMNYPD